MKKKIFLALCLMQSLFVHATPDASNPKLPLVLSSNPRGFSLKAQALYLKFHATGTNASGLQLPPINAVSNNPLNFGYAWGFMVEGAYQLEHGLNFDMNWYHLNHTYLDSSKPFISTSGKAVISTDTRVQPNWNSVNFELGRTIDLSSFCLMRFHTGLEYARIFVEQKTQQSYIDSTQLVSNTQTLNHLFNGFGARFGLSTSHLWRDDFNTYLNAATGVLAGTHSESLLNSNALIATETPTHNYSTSAVVPLIEAEAGGTYSYSIQQGFLKGKLAAHFSWMWINYISALLHINDTPTTGSFSESEFNFALQGPQFGLEWHSD